MPSETQPVQVELRRAALMMTLKSCQLFRGLPESDLSAVASTVRIRNLSKGEYLFREGEPAIGFYVVQSGGINVHRVSPAGKEQVIHVFRRGESMAEAALASPTGYPADSRAVEASAVLVIPKPEFLALLSQRPDLALRMLASMSQHLRVLVGRLDDLTLKDVETRFANWLLKRCQPAGIAQPSVVTLPGTKRVLAAELGVTAETFSRTLAGFRDRGLVSVQGSHIRVSDPAALAALVRRHLGER